ncbi:MAG: AP2/ERF family transcription factor [Gemmatimonadota bacterium]|nr:AP2/ERF family transcription factor [Gemmatimonadota bacterium]
MAGTDTRELRLVDGSVVTVDEPDFWRFWKERLFTSSGFVCYRDKESRVRRLHREILEVRDHRIVIHIDGDQRNCRRSNLLIQDRGIFGRARPSRGASKYKGVSPYRGKWQATIRVEGKLRWLGSFETAEAAARAYDDAVLEHRGRSGVLNFPTRPRRRTRVAATEGEEPLAEPKRRRA